ncbi:cellobiose dehydrogenase [Plectosphaerella plurivora]|uniref:Cellobiose dehydrogenase n=1 Tax=Plectosphaerella plurivora TaxID=936078 RepID=A0A9P9ADL6_9PEZI|nr:cellobiose dehydrogenase [Plectosphaerella plurivora]
MHINSLVLGLGLSLATLGDAACADTYDYIVVGGGPSGLITAERLVEANKKVLLLERGEPATVATGSNNTLSWNDTLTVVDVPSFAPVIPSDLWLCDDTPAFSAACILGGGVSINYLVFVHPPARDFENWPAGWNWPDIAPAAERLYERNPGSTLPSLDGQRYDQGLYATLSSFLDKLGYQSVDMSEQPDEKHNVYSYPAWNIQDSFRAGPLRTYLPLMAQSDKFTLRTGTKVTRVLREGGSATGVEVQNAGGEVETIRLAEGGRVVLSAGAFSTPRILFNSGIGPARQIEAAKTSGVEVPAQDQWIDLPVGRNLKDHPQWEINIQTNGTFVPPNLAGAFNGSDVANVDLYERQGSGVLAQGSHRLLYFTSVEGTDGITRYFQASCSPAGDPGVISLTAYLTHGLTSVGAFGLQDNGTIAYEETVHLTAEADRQAARDFFQTLIDNINAPGSGFSLPDGADIDAIIDSFRVGNHWTGSAKMGTDDGRTNGTSVVDTDTRVYGMDNLFVTDASIHPDLPTGNTQAIVMVAAEAAVAKILAYQG